MSNASEVRHILVVSDSKSRRIVPLTESTYSIGRDPNTNILLYDRQVSRHHATILQIMDEQSEQPLYRIIDGDLEGTRSTNGITVNKKYCLSHDLKSGDEIRFGYKCHAKYHIISNSADLDSLKVENKNDSRFAESSAREIAPSQTINLESRESLDENSLANLAQTSLKKALNQNDSNSKEKLASLTKGNPNPIIEINFKGEITYLNVPARVKFTDLEKSQLNHPIIEGIIEEYSVPRGTSFIREIEVNQNFFEQHIHYVEENNSIRIYLFDITKYKVREAKLNTGKDRYRLFVEQGTEGILLVNCETQYIIESNQAYCQLLGYTTAEIIGLSLHELIAVDKEILDQELNVVTTDNPYFIQESTHRHKDGSLISVAGKISRTIYQGQEIFCLVVRDIRDRKEAQEQLEYQSLHDPLTNLPNRESFNKKLILALEHAQSHQHLMAVMFVDIDSFTNINNTFGHSMGDRLLESFGKRLSSCVRGEDTVARWGSDEYVLLLPQIKNTEDTVKLAQRIFDNLHRPFVLEEERFPIKCSIGIAVYPQDGEDGETLLKNAGTALGRTKEQGRNHYQFYTPNLTSEAALLLRLESSLHQAIENKQFFLHYQPQINLKTGKVVGMEALLRWQHPSLGIITPQKFIPLASKTDLIVHLGKWVLQTACEQNLAWQKDGLLSIPMGVNLSGRELKQANLAEVVARVLHDTGLDPQWLELELTEINLRQNLNQARKSLRDIQNIGVRIALDDFGTGFSSLGYLKQFSFRTLKLDQAFIRDLRGTSSELGIISAALAISKGFNMRIVAEGVETEKQLNILSDLECEDVQGYWFSRPLPAKEATEFLRNSLRG
ncbi:MAG TPA: diguanylate cyclase [Cyanothece sp. UBA12306]|nr:diguanylate cyclase [Cyanothece sp. UBA12306]